MYELLHRTAQAQPDRAALIDQDGSLTYRELVTAAERAAHRLARSGVSRFAIQDARPRVLWPILAAASLTGAEACCYPAAATAEQVALFRERFEHSYFVHADADVTPESLVAEGEPTASLEVPDVRPHLILTSGTSGQPKAARHDWNTMVGIAEGVRPTPEHVWLLAFAVNQFGGQQVLMHVAAAQATLVVPAELQPRPALDAMRQHGVTHASGTPTFWRFLLAEARGQDLPALAQITLSGEAVPGALLDQLSETFTDTAISQIYATTETGHTVTVKDKRPGLPLSVLDGSGPAQFDVREGELWVRSHLSMTGYLGDDAELADWRPTGDLVEVTDDRVLFLGRMSETINVGGVKVDPLPIEEQVSRVPGVTLAHAYGRENAMVGQIVAIDVVIDPAADAKEVRKAVRQACSDLPPAHRPRSINIVDDIEINASKVKRGSLT